MNYNNSVNPIISYFNAEKCKRSIYYDNKNKSGVYRWINLITGESYVGSSICLSRRFSYYYGKNIKKSGISNAIFKYGHYNFSLDIIEYCNKDIIIKREQYYIDLLKPEYNICKIAGSCIGYKHSEETKKLLSDISKGRKHKIEFSLNLSKTRRGIKYKLNKVNKNKNKKREAKSETIKKISSRAQGVNVKIYDRLNNFIKEFPSMRSAAKFVGINRTTISNIFKTGISYDDYNYKFEIKDNRIWIYNSSYKLIKVSKNMKETTKYYNIPLTTLFRYIKSGKLYKNKYFFQKKSCSNHLFSG